MNFLIQYMPLLIQGAYTTFLSWIMAAIISLSIGIFLGIMSSRAFHYKKIRYCITIYTCITKGIPAYVQILIFYFVIPAMLNIQISGFIAASIALAFCSSGYITEIIRSSINTVSQGQWDACFVLGYSKPKAIIRIIAPQAFKIALPALIGEFEQLIKSTSLLATIGVTELTRSGMDIVSRELIPLPIYLSIAMIYLLFSTLLNTTMIVLEKRMNYGRY